MSLILVAPLDGWSAPLDEVPDPVFAGRTTGDGVAIDPTSATLLAPCDGEVIMVAAAKHAVVVRAANGVEILLHIGCDTVTLRGEGFEVHVAQGQAVRTGDPLIRFDLDAVAQRAPSLLTPIVIMDGKGFDIVRRAQERSVRAGEFLMELQQRGQEVVAATGAVRGPEIRRQARVPWEHGIHARPASLLVAALRGLDAEVSALAHGRQANARSAVGWMELGVKRGDEITLTATGRDADVAIAAIERVLAESTPRIVSTNVRPAPIVAASSSQAVDEPGLLRGVIASRGLAIGPAARITGATPEPAETGGDAVRENSELDRARSTVRSDLERLRTTAAGVARELIDAHLALLDDPELLQAARAWIASGKSAGYAWREAIAQSVKGLLSLGDARLAERADDLRDLARQVLRALAGEPPLPTFPTGAILVGEVLLPSQLVALPAGSIAGFCTAGGGPTSHVALLAASMSLPALVAAGPAVLRIEEGTPLVLDAEAGVLRLAPDTTTITATQDAIDRRRSQRQAAQAGAQKDCRLASGERIEVMANIAAAGEVAGALEQGAEGCGLLRTEFLFLDRDTPPSAEEQRDTYQRIVTAFTGRPVVIRTLDAGSDKPLRYLPLPPTENPALGVRGIRASLLRPELLRAQLRAVLSVQPPGACRLLLPMITDAAEIEIVRRMLDELSRELGCPVPPLGAMIETPAAALMADSLARVVDFFSIGSNDLAQYTLAMDRGQAELAAQFDAAHPAVLRLIGSAAEAGRAAGRKVAVCGGLASDPVAAPLLVGLGVNELSAVPSAIPEIKAALRAVTLDECRQLAERALARDAGAKR